MLHPKPTHTNPSKLSKIQLSTFQLGFKMTVQREIQSKTNKVNFEDKIISSFTPRACSAPISLVHLKTWHRKKHTHTSPSRAMTPRFHKECLKPNAAQTWCLQLPRHYFDAFTAFKLLHEILAWRKIDITIKKEKEGINNWKTERRKEKPLPRYMGFMFLSVVFHWKEIHTRDSLIVGEALTHNDNLIWSPFHNIDKLFILM